MVEKPYMLEEIRDSKRPLSVSVSGGKDSMATALWVKELGLHETNPVSYVYADTGWEHPDLTKYIDEVVRPMFAPDFHTVKSTKYPNGMRDLIMAKSAFPSGRMRFCTTELKIVPIRAYLDTLENPINVVGIRAQESHRRSKMDEFEPGGPLGVDCWRPLIDWILGDVIAIHKRHGIKPCPLYYRKRLPLSRVGCDPCIFSKKKEIRSIRPERLDDIRGLEKGLKEKFRQKDPDDERVPTFFSTKNATKPYTIDEAFKWSQTSHGGKKIEMFLPEDGQQGCAYWGFVISPIRMVNTSHEKI